ncbi:MAG: tRNA pseudouridine(55) synthase TruB [Chloroflexi bacterium]|nr:tRNA pseudouridine(55) synthase TruB [Chloroflexota bacterium]
MAGTGPAVSGILNLYKPVGPTSHDMVARVRRLFGQRQVGHAGTLDPLAEGVLLICLGAATRMSQYLMDGPKTYLADVTLGATSITDDAEGTLMPGRPVSCTRADVLQALGRFLGEIQQVPPRYAAIKRDGVPLYKLARRGQAVTPPPRPVHIQAIHLLSWQPPHMSLLVTCHAGTYIRSLARDVGTLLRCGGYLSGLVRLCSGRFTAGDAVTLEQLELAVDAGFAADLLYPVDTALLDRDAVILGPDSVARLRQGQALPAHGRPTGPAPYRAYSSAGDLVALVTHRTSGDQALWQPQRVFATTD